jgi:hypothetical protein
VGKDEGLVSGKFLNGWQVVSISRKGAVMISEVGMAALYINVNSLGLIVVSVRRRHHV